MDLFGGDEPGNWDRALCLCFDIAPGLASTPTGNPPLGPLLLQRRGHARATDEARGHGDRWHQPPAPDNTHEQAPPGRKRLDTRSREPRQEQPINLNLSHSSPTHPPNPTFPYLPSPSRPSSHHPSHPPGRSAPPDLSPQAHETQRQEGKTAVNHHNRGHLLTSKVPLLHPRLACCGATIPRQQNPPAFTRPACNSMCPCA